MTFLDDLFSAADNLNLNPGPALQLGEYYVYITASVAISPPSWGAAPYIFKPSPVAWGYAYLMYTPAQEDGAVVFPPYFEGAFLARTETFASFEFPQGPGAGQDWPGPLGNADESIEWMGLKLSYTVLLPSNYEITVSGKTFIPSIDPANNVIYGTAGINFVVISLIDPLVYSGS
jgi:hypothetical protein